MSTATRGIAWAMCRPHDARPIVFAVIGSTIYKRTPDSGWQDLPCADEEIADSFIIAAINVLEDDGAVLVLGPREFDYGTRVGAIPIGWIVERTLRLKDSVPSL